MREGRWHPGECKVCGARAPSVSISATGLCPDHSRMREEANLRQLVEHRGPWFDHYRRRMLAAFGYFGPLDASADGG